MVYCRVGIWNKEREVFSVGSKKKFDFEIVKNPRIFQENRLEAHSDHVCYANWYEQQNGETSYRMSLDGVWKFSYANNMDSVIEGFEAQDYSCNSWDSIRAPSLSPFPQSPNGKYQQTKQPEENDSESSVKLVLNAAIP